MRNVLTISLPNKLQKKIDKIAKRRNSSRSDIIRESLKNYLFELEFEELRNKFIPKAQAKGIFTDEDVFKIVS
jgi:metal-responsive CopG/Arc/MetJ family transcriptional regulator